MIKGLYLVHLISNDLHELIRSPLSIYISVIILLSSCSPAPLYNGTLTSPIITDSTSATIDGNWWPYAMLFHLHDMADSLVFSNTVNYDSIFEIEGISQAFLHIKSDTLHERIVYDSCYKENHIKMIFEDIQVHYAKQPFLLSNPEIDNKNEEYLFLKGKDTLHSTMTFYVDTLQLHLFANQYIKR